jgi:hypothetical protein
MLKTSTKMKFVKPVSPEWLDSTDAENPSLAMKIGRGTQPQEAAAQATFPAPPQEAPLTRLRPEHRHLRPVPVMIARRFLRIGIDGREEHRLGQSLAHLGLRGAWVACRMRVRENRTGMAAKVFSPNGVDIGRGLVSAEWAPAYRRYSMDSCRPRRRGGKPVELPEAA